MAFWGWIDFSKADRDLARDIIASLNEPGAVDELGIGIIRDGFSDVFFPGTSTIQTKAKYFFLVAYELEALSRTSGKHLVQTLDDNERKLSFALWNNAPSETEGVFGRMIFRQNRNGWVKRPPSAVYWNGLKKLGFLECDNPNLSLSEFLRLVEKQEVAPTEIEDNDDPAARKARLPRKAWNWHLPPMPDDWREHPAIKLTLTEAQFLREQILTKQRDTLFAVLVEKRSSLPDSFDNINPEWLPEALRRTWQTAKAFSQFMKPAQCRYNALLKNEDALREWEKRKANYARFAESADRDIDLKEVMTMAKIGITSPQTASLKGFLSDLKEVYLNFSESELDALLVQREQLLKGPRAKLKPDGNPDAFYQDHWVGGYGLEYRFPDAIRLIQDINMAEARNNA